MDFFIIKTMDSKLTDAFVIAKLDLAIHLRYSMDSITRHNFAGDKK